MLRKSLLFFGSIFFINMLILTNLVFAEETLTITTYYPSPHGVYKILDLPRGTGGGGELRLRNTNNGTIWAMYNTGSANGQFRLTYHDGSNWASTPYIVVKSNGNVGFGVTNPTSSFVLANGARNDGGVWVDGSDRNKKENFTNLSHTLLNQVKLSQWTKNAISIPAIEYKDGDSVALTNEELISRIKLLPIMRWNFIDDSTAETANSKKVSHHIGPTAQDFYKMFGLGSDDVTVASLDLAGVSIAAIKAQQEAIESLEIRNKKLVAKHDLLILRLSELEKKTELLKKILILTID